MKSKSNRRNFIKKSGRICAGGCLLAMSPELFAGTGFSHLLQETPNPKELCYCGYKCPDDCKFLLASKKNDPELKKAVYEEWKVKERFGVEYEADKIFCFGCKNKEKPAGVVLKGCTVRQCAMEKELECCIECDELADCEKDLWARFPEFKKQVVKMQADWNEAQG